MVKRKAAVADGQAGLKKRKAGLVEQLTGGSSGPAVLAPPLLKGSQDVPKAVGSIRGTGLAKRPGKAKRSRAEAHDAAEIPLPEAEGAAAQPLEREDASGAAATAAGLLENGKAAAAEAAFRNREKVLLLSSRGITHRHVAPAGRKIIALAFSIAVRPGHKHRAAFPQDTGLLERSCTSALSW